MTAAVEAPTRTSEVPAGTPHNPHHTRRWAILAFLALAQLMVVLDATIVNIALPSPSSDLGFSDGNRQWIVTAYALAFGSLLLLGGRIADLFGRKRTFVIGLIGFAVASALGGAARASACSSAPAPLQGVVRRAARARRAVAARRRRSPTPRSAPRRSASTVRSPVAAAPSACSSAVC